MADSLRLLVTADPVVNGTPSPLTVVSTIEQVGTSLTAGSGENLFTIIGTPEPVPFILHGDPPEEAYVDLIGPVHIVGQGPGWSRIAREAHSAALVHLTLFVQGDGPEDPWSDVDLDGPRGPWIENGAPNDGTPNNYFGGHWQLWTIADKVIKGFITVEDAVGELVVGDLELTVTRRAMLTAFQGPTGHYNSIGHLVVV